jgi:hypothetical protein
MNDDDLPVLTHVLRTAAGHMPPSLRLPDDVFAEDFDLTPFDEMRTDEPIIIGNDPAEIDTDAHDTPTSDDPPQDEAVVEPGTEIVADPRQPLVTDAFQLPQDVDESITTSALPIDEFGVATLDHEPLHQFDTPIVFASADLEALAVRVREAVLTDLSARIDTELDARIAQAMHAELETALAHLQGNLRSHLTDALRDVVARAVDEQIARISWSAASPRVD